MKIEIDHIEKTVADYFNQPVSLIGNKTRNREIVQSRQIIMFFSKNMTNQSLTAIGRRIGGKTHATVMYSIKAVDNMIETNKRFANYIDEIERKIRSTIAGIYFKVYAGEKVLFNDFITDKELYELFNADAYNNLVIRVETYIDSHLVPGYFMLSDITDKPQINLKTAI